MLHAAKHKQTLADKGVLELVIDGMRKYMQDPLVQDYVCGALQTLILNGSLRVVHLASSNVLADDMKRQVKYGQGLILLLLVYNLYSYHQDAKLHAESALQVAYHSKTVESRKVEWGTFWQVHHITQQHSYHSHHADLYQ